MKTELIYNKANREEFFAKIEELIDKDKHTECINVLESIPAEERDYEITYQLARALQNFALIGDDGMRTEYEIGYGVLLKSLEILESVRAEGIHRPEWNMRMAYGYQYLSYQHLTCQEEKAIHYAMRWAELDPEDKNALEVIKECQEEIEKRKKIHETYAEIEDWDAYLCRWFDEQPASVSVNLALLDFEEKDTYTKRIQLSVMLKNPDENGLPTEEEEESLSQIEDLVESIIKEKQDILVAFLRCDSRLSIFSYVKNAEGYEEAFAAALKEQFPDYEYQFWVDEDEAWETYFNVLYPNKYDYQGILNNRLIDQIQMNGDTMVPRVLEHCLYFKTKEKRKSFLDEVVKEGFKEMFEGADDTIDLSVEYPYQLVVGREDDFRDTNRVTWYLMETAEELDGEYDGWGCVPVKE